MLGLQWIDEQERLIRAHHQPALLIDLLCSRGLSSHKVLRGTGLFYEDILAGDQTLSRTQLRQLISNARKLSPEGELAFRWGSQFWPGHYGSFSHVLSSAASLRQALESLIRYQQFLSPGLSLKLVEDEGYAYLQWLMLVDGEESRFMLEAAMTGLVSMTRWLANEKYPWQFLFSYNKPDYEEQYQVHLGSRLHFGVGVDAMVIEQHWLDRPWPNHSSIALHAAQRDCEAQLQVAGCSQLGLPETLYNYLVHNIQQPLHLTDVAEQFGMSQATFKRKLSKSGCTYQRLHDQARLHVCLYLLHVKGWNNEQVSDHLNFNDTTNFRRAFKRWVGMTPSDSRHQLGLLAGTLC